MKSRPELRVTISEIEVSDLSEKSRLRAKQNDLVLLLEREGPQ